MLSSLNGDKEKFKKFKNRFQGGIRQNRLAEGNRKDIDHDSDDESSKEN